MFGFLCQHYHLPRSSEDRLVALFLPEFNVELAVWKLAFNEPRLPFRLRLVFIFHRDLGTSRIHPQHNDGTQRLALCDGLSVKGTPYARSLRRRLIVQPNPVWRAMSDLS